MSERLSRKEAITALGASLVALGLWGSACRGSSQNNTDDFTFEDEEISLPVPDFMGAQVLEEVVKMRRSQRTFSKESLTLGEISQLCWAAQGITHPNGFRTAPSAGALYPLEIYFLAGDILNLAKGLYKYLPKSHSVKYIVEGDRREALYEAALRQSPVKEAPAVIVLAGEFMRTTRKYGERGDRYVFMEVGFAAQNIYLQTHSLGLGTVFIGAFYDEEVRKVLGMELTEQPLGLMPVGKL